MEGGRAHPGSSSGHEFNKFCAGIRISIHICIRVCNLLNSSQIF